MDDPIHICNALLVGRGPPHGRRSVGDPGIPVVLHNVHTDTECACSTFTQKLYSISILRNIFFTLLLLLNVLCPLCGTKEHTLNFSVLLSYIKSGHTKIQVVWKVEHYDMPVFHNDSEWTSFKSERYWMIMYYSPVQSLQMHAGLKRWTQWRSDTLTDPRGFSGTWETLYTGRIDKERYNLYKIKLCIRSFHNAGDGEMQEGHCNSEAQSVTPSDCGGFLSSNLSSVTEQIWVCNAVTCRTCLLQAYLHYNTILKVEWALSLHGKTDCCILNDVAVLKR